MKSRHAAVLALLGSIRVGCPPLEADPIGWHLLTPPLDSTGVRPDLPLKRWKLSQREFESRDGCLQFRKAYLAAFSKEANAKIHDSSWVAKYVGNIADYTECISTDDPRFPGDFHRWWSHRSQQNIQPEP